MGHGNFFERLFVVGYKVVDVKDMGISLDHLFIFGCKAVGPMAHRDSLIIYLLWVTKPQAQFA